MAKRTKKTSLLEAVRFGPTLEANPGRVLLRKYPTSSTEQAKNVVSRILALSEKDLPKVLVQVLTEFEGRHQDYKRILLERFESINHLLASDQELTVSRKLVLGAAFSMEYSLECAALFNPSIVEHPDQSTTAPDSLRFILSLRATGEGHISSVTFREGILDAQGELSILAPSRYVVEPQAVSNPSYERDLFGRKLRELGLSSAFTKRVVQSLDEEFTLQDLRYALSREHWRSRNSDTESDQIPNIDNKILSLALSNYQVRFEPDHSLSRQALYPVTPSQSNGIEDVRLVRFEDGTYYGTYTAYDGRMIMPQLLETDDFITYRFITLNGPAVKNKGMALFPRRIQGLYTMLGRQDGENISLMQSDNIHFWNEAQVIVRPKYPWEIVQLGNCGSPIETEAGWLVLTHGVGPNRKYSIGALLLDLENPTKVLGRLKHPLLSPEESEREGYVPNVVYTCGSMVWKDNLIIPFAVSDSATRFAKIGLKSLLETLRP